MQSMFPLTILSFSDPHLKTLPKRVNFSQLKAFMISTFIIAFRNKQLPLLNQLQLRMIKKKHHRQSPNPTKWISSSPKRSPRYEARSSYFNYRQATP